MHALPSNMHSTRQRAGTGGCRNSTDCAGLRTLQQKRNVGLNPHSGHRSVQSGKPVWANRRHHSHRLVGASGGLMTGSDLAERQSQNDPNPSLG